MIRGTRAALDAQAVANNLLSGEPYFINDEDPFAIGKSPGSYAVVGGGKLLQFVSAEYNTAELTTSNSWLVAPNPAPQIRVSKPGSLIKVTVSIPYVKYAFFDVQCVVGASLQRNNLSGRAYGAASYYQQSVNDYGGVCYTLVDNHGYEPNVYLTYRIQYQRTSGTARVGDASMSTRIILEEIG
jgi:hypothetical protein